jgi:carbamate kinase
MNGTIVVLVSGEALAGGNGSTFKEQRLNAKAFAEGLYPILQSGTKLAVLHGNKPQVGFVLFRSEVASHVLHPIPLDVCGADTQGATGYMISQALMNVLGQHQVERQVMSIFTQTLVEPGTPSNAPLTAIGPWFDREKADQYRQTRGWQIVEEPGRGYRRGVPSLRPQKILEIETIRKLVNDGDIVIAAGGGGIPVMRNSQGNLEGIEVVLETELVASKVAQQLNANILVMIIDRDDKFLLSGLTMSGVNTLSLEELDQILSQESLRSSTVKRTLDAASEFLHNGGEQVMITSLKNLPEYLTNKRGLRIGSRQPSVELFAV